MAHWTTMEEILPCLGKFVGEDSFASPQKSLSSRFRPGYLLL